METGTSRVRLNQVPGVSGSEDPEAKGSVEFLAGSIRPMNRPVWGSNPVIHTTPRRTASVPFLAIDASPAATCASVRG